MPTESIFSDAPKFISQRFATINSYMWNSFYPENSLNKELYRLETDAERKKELKRLKEIINEASTIALILLLKKFFEDGTKAAVKAVDTFEELGVEGFQIGSKYFSGRNENVLEGQILAERLLASINNPELINLINNSNSVIQIVNRYRPIIEKKNNG